MDMSKAVINKPDLKYTYPPTLSFSWVELCYLLPHAVQEGREWELLLPFHGVTAILSSLTGKLHSPPLLWHGILPSEGMNFSKLRVPSLGCDPPSKKLFCHELPSESHISWGSIPCSSMGFSTA